MMWQGSWREASWSRLDQPWDMIIVGGGVTGAGVAWAATHAGLRTLLVEQRDFAWGTSSRSSKLVHGGLRYLAQGKLGLVRDAVRERERLLATAPGLVEPLGFLLTLRRGDRPGKTVYRAALTLYDLLAGRRASRFYDPATVLELVPRVAASDLIGAIGYADAQTDDARLVLRLVSEAVAGGAVALNYVAAVGLVWQDERVVGVQLRDGVTARTADVRGRVVVNATGAWADRLRDQTGAASQLRPLRGSHLVFPAWRLPVAQAISFRHPVDRRYVFLTPWEGVTVVGTTDVDHDRPLEDEPAIAPAEVAYLMAAVTAQFPTLNLTLDDVISTWSGVRPVIGGDQADPSQEGRDHAVWEDKGLLTVTGGKLTTFHLMALDVLAAAARASDLPSLGSSAHGRVFEMIAPALPVGELGWLVCRRLTGRYGAAAAALLAAAQPGDLDTVPGTPYLWAELRWAARAEAVLHLDDLLLRRVRLGLLLAEGGAALLPRIRAVCQPELGWDDARWAAEEAAYLALWRAAYSLPERSSIPDWRHLLAEAGVQTETSPGTAASRLPIPMRLTMVVALAIVAAALLRWGLARRHQPPAGGDARRE